MSIRKLRAGRVPGVTAAEYVGVQGTIFWNENTGEFRLSNGVTPGGIRVGFPVASLTEIGGIKLGPGITLNQNDQLIIDSTGLDFSFGNLTGTVGTYPVDYYQEERQDHDYAVLGSINVDEDIILASNGTGAVRVVGDFSVRRANGSLNGALSEEPIFRVKSDGQIQLLVPSADSTEGAFTIVGGLDGVFQAPVNTGVMMHITGIASSPDPTPSRIYNDAQNSFGAFVTRRYNGTAAAPTAVLDGEEILRLSGTAHNGTSIPGTGNQRIIYKALGNQTLTNQGGTMEFWTTPLNTTTMAKVATVSSTGITLESGKVLTGNVTGKADTAGNADTVTNGVYTNGSYSDPSWLTISKSKVGLSAVENTALSTWAGSSNITTVGTLTDLSVTNTISGSINGTAAIATTVTLVATNTTAATHYLTFVDTATGNENVRTDTGLTYNPGTNTLGAGIGAFTTFTGKYIRNLRDAGTIGDGGTLTIDFSTDAVVYCVWANGMTIAYQNYTAGSVVKIMARKATGSGVDTFSLGGLTAAQVSTGSTTSSNISADTTAFIELTCTSTTIGSVYAKL